MPVERSATITVYPRTGFPGRCQSLDPDAPVVLLSENFESGTLGIFSQFGTSSIVVAHEPDTGTYALRNNICGSILTNDPYTGVARDGLHTPELEFDQIPDHRNYSKRYVEWRVRVDAASFIDGANGGVPAHPKWCYVGDESIDSTRTACAIFPTLTVGGGIGGFAANQGTNDPLPVVSGGTIYGTCLDCGFAFDGNYHTIGVLHDTENSTMEWWVNGVKFLGNPENGIAVDGVIPVAEFFRIDAIRFWHVNSNTTNGSTDAEPEIAGGVQIDNLLVTNGVPV